MQDKSIIDEIDKAEKIYACHGRRLLSNSALMDLARQYRKANLLTQDIMIGANVVESCMECAAGASGSCCFCGAEEDYDHILLLINLLLGSEIPRIPEVSDACLFVDSGGCRLTARHAFCVNYLCPHLMSTLQEATVMKLLSAAGYELSLGWELEQRIRRWLKKESISDHY